MVEFSVPLSQKNRQKLDVIEKNLLCHNDKQFLMKMIERHYMPDNELSRINFNTCVRFTPLWLSNIKQNLPVIWKSRDAMELLDKHQKKGYKSGIVIGAGPSADHDSLRMLAESNYKGFIIACDHILIKCLEAGVVPDVVTNVDGQPVVAEWFKHPLIRKHRKDIDYLLPCAVHPDVIRVLKRRGVSPYFFLAGTSEKIMPNLTKILMFITDKTMMNAALNVGAFSWQIASLDVGCKTVGLLGLDFAYPTGLGSLMRTQKFMGRVDSVGGKTIIRKDGEVDVEFPCRKCKRKDCPNPDFVCKGNVAGLICLHELYAQFRRVYNPFFKKWVLQDADMQLLSQSMRNNIRIAKKKMGVRTLVCSWGSVFGKGIRCMEFKDFLRRHKK